MQAGNEWLKTLPKSSQGRKKPPPHTIWTELKSTREKEYILRCSKTSCRSLSYQQPKCTKNMHIVWWERGEVGGANFTAWIMIQTNKPLDQKKPSPTGHETSLSSCCSHTHPDGFSLADTDRPRDASPQTLVERHGHGQETSLRDGGQGHTTVCAIKLCAILKCCIQNPDHRFWGFLLCEHRYEVCWFMYKGRPWCS